MSRPIQQHFVTFYSPGTFVSEETTKPISEWNVSTAKRMAHRIKERYGATPHSFRFSTRTRKASDLDSKVSARSPLYWLGGRIETRAEVEARNDPNEEILRSNMRSNKIERVVINDNSWRFTAPLGETDIVLDFKP
jgi:hypothetical protein